MKKLLILAIAIIVAISSTVYASISTNFNTEKYTFTKEEYDLDAFEAKAKSLGMTLEELKAKIIEDKKVEYEAFKAKAESLGLTIEELKEKLIEQKKGK